MEFLDVGNTITKIKNLNNGFYSSLDKDEDLIREILKIGHSKMCEKA